jgi:hypothetical protein
VSIAPLISRRSMLVTSAWKGARTTSEGFSSTWSQVGEDRPCTRIGGRWTTQSWFAGATDAPLGSIGTSPRSLDGSRVLCGVAEPCFDMGSARDSSAEESPREGRSRRRDTFAPSRPRASIPLWTLVESRLTRVPTSLKRRCASLSSSMERLAMCHRMRRCCRCCAGTWVSRERSPAAGRARADRAPFSSTADR